VTFEYTTARTGTDMLNSSYDALFPSELLALVFGLVARRTTLVARLGLVDTVTSAPRCFLLGFSFLAFGLSLSFLPTRFGLLSHCLLGLARRSPLNEAGGVSLGHLGDLKVEPTVLISKQPCTKPRQHLQSPLFCLKLLTLDSRILPFHLLNFLFSIRN